MQAWDNKRVRPRHDPWFVVDTKRPAAYLDSGTWLVDAGDYDSEGRPELVFSINRYNRGGYEIFYNDFKKRAVFGLKRRPQSRKRFRSLYQL